MEAGDARGGFEEGKRLAGSQLSAEGTPGVGIKKGSDLVATLTGDESARDHWGHGAPRRLNQKNSTGQNMTSGKTMPSRQNKAHDAWA